ncbi:hypothetical protein C8F04DRAFT_1182799 [Mycena alexandri]|uniref:Uncharacterized protein n=1 Tax=Mycena alexandri TaxID=1745969 RepID=A0AAD6SWN4_9AGAR|nr:hypothetical protein C8F04DRAFT_1184790 [Mycena alexandri]KAJ7034802.1 hypothetical protein C8F04DRAFT_1182799 [Mycena alexandri]
MFTVSPRPTVISRFRGLAPVAIRRPRRFWDVHIPKTRARNWVSIPDANLPEPWTCNWATVDWTAEERPLEATLASRYALGNVPLTPVMFNAAEEATVFGCAGTGKFFLHHREWYPPWASGPREVLQVYTFEGIFSSVEAFIEQADWNCMERMEPVGLVQQVSTQPVVPLSIAPALPLISEKGFRIAAEEPYQKRTLWEMCPPPGTLGYKPRRSPDGGRSDSYRYPRVSEWPRTPDAALPEPWSADWDAFARTYNWYDEVQVELEERFGHDLVGLVPALFEPADGYPEDTVLCPPGGAGTYYLWGSSLRWEMCWRAPMPEMQRFRGVFASVEHFVRAADWNSLEEVIECNDGYWS